MDKVEAVRKQVERDLFAWEATKDKIQSYNFQQKINPMFTITEPRSGLYHPTLFGRIRSLCIQLSFHLEVKYYLKHMDLKQLQLLREYNREFKRLFEQFYQKLAHRVRDSSRCPGALTVTRIRARITQEEDLSSCFEEVEKATQNFDMVWEVLEESCKKGRERAHRNMY